MAVRSKWGKLFLDFCWRGKRCREFTGLADTRENRKKAEAFLQVIKGQIALGTFDYRWHFPNGARLTEFYPEITQRRGALRIGEYLDAWQERRSPFLPDGSVAEAAELHPSTWVHDESVIRCHLKPEFGSLRLDQLTASACKDFRKRLQDKKLSGKTATNVLGILHKAMADAVEDGLIESNPVPRLTRRRRAALPRSTSDPLTVEEVKSFLDAVPKWYRDLYDVWFRVGWRPSEILAIRFDWLDFQRQTVLLKRGRIPRRGGLEAPPKTGVREVDCRYDPAIFVTFTRLKRRSIQTGKRDFVFTDEDGNPLSQERLHKKLWLPTLRALGLRTRGQYNIRDTFISLALSAGEDPGWVAQVCGTSERMIFQHYRKFMANLRRQDGRRIAGLYRDPAAFWHRIGTGEVSAAVSMRNLRKGGVEAGGIEPPSGSGPPRLLRA
jgi:integrase